MRLLRWTFRLLPLALLVASVWYWTREPEIPTGSYLVVELAGEIPERGPSHIVARLMGRGGSLVDHTTALRKARSDGRIAGVLVRIGSMSAGWAQTQEIRSALALVKAQGKKVVAELEIELAKANKELYLATVADKVYVAPAAGPIVAGLAAKYVFFGGLWPKLGVRMEVEKIRDYKTAGDEIAGESMSEAHREMADWLIDDIHGHLVRTIAEARGLTVTEVNAVIDRAPSLPEELVEAGLVDGVKSFDDVLLEIGGGEKPVETVTMVDYSNVAPRSLGLGGGPKIAVVHAAGPVELGTPAPGSTSVGSRPIASALDQAAADPDIAAIVVRVSSPGGSPEASDEIWLAVRRAAKKKPVVASLGDIAASGGYYLACGADRIVADATSLTGSIGVVFFKPDFTELLSNVGLHSETVARGRYSRLLDLDKPFDADEVALIRKQLDSTYGLFLARVAEGRRKDVREIDAVAEGRVWTGQQALEHGLVDELGTLEDAVRIAANSAGIHDVDKIDYAHYPRSENVLQEIARLSAGGTYAPPAVRALTEALGDQLSLLELSPGVLALATAPAIE